MLNVLAPFRRRSFDFSKAALVISLSAEVRAPATAKPAMNDYNETRRCISSKNRLIKSNLSKLETLKTLDIIKPG